MFYYFAEYCKDFLDIKREASQDEYERIEPYLKMVSQMIVDKNRIEPVVFAHKSLTESIANLSEEHQLQGAKEIQYKLSQFLFEFKKFIDNWETDITRKFGKNSDEFKRLKKVQAEEYDNHMEYRIMYRLRNYDQHCGNIISNVTAYLDENNKPSYKILMNREVLLNSFDEWKQPEIDYLKQQDEHIEIEPYVQQLHASIYKIYEKTMKIHFTREFLLACAEIVNIANEFENEDYVQIISNDVEIDELFWKQPTKTFNFTHLMVPLCKQILSLHIKNNLNVVKVFYWGESLRKRLGYCAIGVDSGVASKICNSQFVSLAGQKMIRLFMRLFIDENEMYSVLIGVGRKYSEIREISSDYSKYLKALCKK